ALPKLRGFNSITGNKLLSTLIIFFANDSVSHGTKTGVNLISDNNKWWKICEANASGWLVQVLIDPQ
ncbi:hypothetical protein J6590_104272, partial [Homalodisca vitripennis]